MNNIDKCTLKKLNTNGWRNKDSEFRDIAQRFICKHALRWLNKFTFNKGVKL